MDYTQVRLRILESLDSSRTCTVGKKRKEEEDREIKEPHKPMEEIMPKDSMAQEIKALKIDHPLTFQVNQISNRKPQTN